MKYVLDTNVVSALMRGDRPEAERLRAAGRDAVTIPSPVFAEIEYGVARLPESKRRALFVDRLAAIRGELGRAEWTAEVDAAFGRIKAGLERRGERLEDLDVAIAAHASATRSVLATANVKHFSRIPDLVVDDWSGES